MGIYVVKKGDTGESIAKSQTPPLSLPQIFAANPGVNWDNLPVGYHIHVPGYKTTQYVIVPGDSGLAIAGRLGIGFAQLENLNPGTKWTTLEVGKTITIPSFESDRAPLLKDCVGAPISGVPAQMPAPVESVGKAMSEAIQKKVTTLIGGSEDNVANAIKKVVGLDWVGCFFHIYRNAKGLTPGGAPSTVIAIVDLRDPKNQRDTDVVPWKIPASLSLPCAEGKSNATVFNDASKGKDLAVLFSSWKQLRQVIFVDTHGHGRAPEIATRYAQWIGTANRAGVDPEPQIFFVAGGLASYCNAQCFGRVLLNTPNPYVLNLSLDYHTIVSEL
ncbi:uncharacterized protein Z519_05894 [Cladophialophora bantiana CBS 173.52]|uniref:LysM domain-containing protein n=1 Tax=Cladophialophora bantiana (strain ATCC 10958 / CBS 173.52 / CDC B-1940 / NIH 8579) TaxID=1442370 RepID=A0A0D2I934_CLAB1|nr:uncharacterized protein Z519_05894 [Cladophialophora bantiana CBS 173.52]KIW93289.1 hypothetical protein Z519_05894 [Cladophialophora bantiana CBS 173.52]